MVLPEIYWGGGGGVGMDLREVCIAMCFGPSSFPLLASLGFSSDVLTGALVGGLWLGCHGDLLPPLWLPPLNKFS